MTEQPTGNEALQAERISMGESHCGLPNASKDVVAAFGKTPNKDALKINIPSTPDGQPLRTPKQMEDLSAKVQKLITDGKCSGIYLNCLSKSGQPVEAAQAALTFLEKLVEYEGDSAKAGEELKKTSPETNLDGFSAVVVKDNGKTSLVEFGDKSTVQIIRKDGTIDDAKPDDKLNNGDKIVLCSTADKDRLKQLTGESAAKIVEKLITPPVTEKDTLTTVIKSAERRPLDPSTPSEDRSFVSKDTGFAGVIDGAGGIGTGGKDAAEAVHAVFTEQVDKAKLSFESKTRAEAEAKLREIAVEANRAVRAKAPDKAACASLGQIYTDKDGNLTFSYLSSGDTEIAIVKKDGTVVLVPNNSVRQLAETRGIDIYLSDREAAVDLFEGQATTSLEDKINIGSITLGEGDRVVFLTDGVAEDLQNIRGDVDAAGKITPKKGPDGLQIGLDVLGELKDISTEDMPDAVMKLLDDVRAATKTGGIPIERDSSTYQRKVQRKIVDRGGNHIVVGGKGPTQDKGYDDGETVVCMEAKKTKEKVVGQANGASAAEAKAEAVVKPPAVEAEQGQHAVVTAATVAAERVTIPDLEVRYLSDIPGEKISVADFKAKYPKDMEAVVGPNGLLEQAKKLLPPGDKEGGIDHEIRVLKAIERIIRNPDQIEPGDEKIAEMVGKQINAARTAFVCMATEAAAAERMFQANQDRRTQHNSELAQEHRLDVKTKVNHADSTSYVEGDFNHVFWQETEIQQLVDAGTVTPEQADQMRGAERGPEWKKLPQKDLYAFTLVADKLLDVEFHGKTTYRDVMRKLEDVINDPKASAAEKSNASKRLVDIRKDFYINFIEATRTINKSQDLNPDSSVDRDKTLLQMHDRLQQLASDPDMLDTLLKDYKGVGVKGDRRSKEVALNTKHRETMKKILGGNERQFILDYALKGADLMRRRISYSLEGQLYEVPAEVHFKQFEQRNKSLDEIAKEPVVKPPPSSGPRPAPTSGEPIRTSVEPPAPPKTELPKEVEFGMVAAKQRIDHVTASGKKIDDMEVLEERDRETAYMLMTEDRKKWSGKLSWLKQAIPRLWKFNFGNILTGSKEKSHAHKLYAESGIQMTTLRYDFISDVDDVARQTIKTRRTGVKKLLGGIKDFANEFSFTEKDLHRERIEVVRQLRHALEHPTDPTDAAFIAANKALYEKYTKMIDADFKAAESTAQRVSSEFGKELVHTLVGEKRAQEAVLLSGPVGDFFRDRVVREMLTAGLTGTLSPEKMLQIRGEIQNFFFDKRFIDWYGTLPKDAQDSLKLSLSYGTDIVPFIQEVILPQVLQAKEHNNGVFDLDNYVKEMVLKVRVGTLESGQKGTMQEGRLERWSNRSIKNSDVLKLYQEVSSGGSVQAVPDAYLDASTNRAAFVGKMAAVATNHMVLGIGLATGLYVGKVALKGVAKGLTPILGGSVVGGFFRGVEEWGKFNQEYQQYGIESEIGYTRGPDAKRSMQMEGIMMHQREMTPMLIDPMQQAMQKIESGHFSEAETLQFLGVLADTGARIHLNDTYGDLKGRGFLRSQDPQSWQVEHTNLEITNARAKVALKKLFSTNPALVASLQTQLGITVPVGGDAAEWILGTLTQAQENQIRTGLISNPAYQAALSSLSIQQKESITARESALKWTRAKRVGGAVLMTMAGGIGGFYGGKLLSMGLNKGLEAIASSPGAVGPVGWLRNELMHKNFLHPVLVRDELPAGSPVDIPGLRLKMDMPAGFKFDHVDAANNIITVTNGGKNFDIPFFVDPNGDAHIANLNALGPGFQMVEKPNIAAAIQKQIQTGFTAEQPIVIAAGTPPIGAAGMNLNLPPGFSAQPVAGGISVVDNNNLPHIFNFGKDAKGAITLIPQDPKDTLVPHLGPPPVAVGFAVPPGPLGPRAVDIAKFVAGGGIEKAGMTEVQSPGSVDFHVIWPEHVAATGDHAGHELEMHWTKGVINFAGVVNKNTIDPHITGLMPRHDVQLEGLIEHAPDKQINPQDMFVVMMRRSGERLYAALDKDGNFKLPDEFVDKATGRPDGNVFKWIGAAVIQKPNDGAIIQATEWVNGGRDMAELQGVQEHFLTSLDLKGTDLPPVTIPEIPPQTIDFGIREPIMETITQNVNQVDISWHSNGSFDFPVPIFWPRQPLEAPDATRGEAPNALKPRLQKPPGTPPKPPIIPPINSVGPISGQPNSVTSINSVGPISGQPNSVTSINSVGSISGQPNSVTPINSVGSISGQPASGVSKSTSGKNIDKKDGSEPVQSSAETGISTGEDRHDALSDTLKENPKAKLDPLIEINRYMSAQQPDHLKAVNELAQQIDIPLHPNAKAVVCIPVAGHQEAANIYRTLENYTFQTLSPDQFELILFVNNPKFGKNGEPLSSTETFAEIDRFKREHPNFPLRVLYKQFEKPVAIGSIRKLLSDTVLLRQQERKINDDLIIISNDADCKGVAPKYIENFIQKFDKYPECDGLSGQLDWDPEEFVSYPLIHVATRFFQYANKYSSTKWHWVNTSGANFAYKSSIYAGVGGYSGDSQGEDTIFGQKITDARNTLQVLQNAGAVNSRLYTSARRAISYLEKGLSPIEQWDRGFGAFDDEVRKFKLGEQAKIDFSDAKQRKDYQDSLEYLLNRTVDRFQRWEAQPIDRTGPMYQAAFRWLGIKYEVVNDRIHILDIDPLINGLQHYQEIGILLRDIKSGRGTPEKEQKLKELEDELRKKQGSLH